MAGKKTKGTSRKIKDKWKAKEWYKVLAPRMFSEIEIGETPSADPEYLVGRTAEVTVHDLTGDFSKMHIKLRFRIANIDGHNAKTAFIGHDLTSDYVRRLTRRKKTKTDHVTDVVTKDNFTIRIKPMSIAEKRIQTAQEQAMRQIMGETLVKMGTEMSLSEIVKTIVSGEMAKELARACRCVIPVKRIEIRRSEVLAAGEGDPESIIDAVTKKNEPEDAAEADDAADGAEVEIGSEDEAEAEAEGGTEADAEAEAEDEAEAEAEDADASDDAVPDDASEE
ncbi:MAG: 30S ribosomal protein S3ae [Methanomassiliicoccaceae archaeon]|nr:30S ribosomal protein S3ae [Methanomassiliicoccaceae archaeon]